VAPSRIAVLKMESVDEQLADSGIGKQEVVEAQQCRRATDSSYQIIACNQVGAATPADVGRRVGGLLNRCEACDAMCIEHVVPDWPPVFGTHLRAVLDGVIVLTEVAHTIKPSIFQVDVNGE
jgi:hypothetical protein